MENKSIMKKFTQIFMFLDSVLGLGNVQFGLGQNELSSQDPKQLFTSKSSQEFEANFEV